MTLISRSLRVLAVTGCLALTVAQAQSTTTPTRPEPARSLPGPSRAHAIQRMSGARTADATAADTQPQNAAPTSFVAPQTTAGPATEKTTTGKTKTRKAEAAPTATTPLQSSATKSAGSKIASGKTAVERGAAAEPSADIAPAVVEKTVSITRSKPAATAVPFPAASTPAGAANSEGSLVLVSQGQARAVIVVQVDSPFAELAARELKVLVERASGAKLGIVGPDDAARLSDDYVRILVGPGPLTVKAGIDTEKLERGEFRIRTAPGTLALAGRDAGLSPLEQRASPATWHAVAEFGDRWLGACRLWPGEAGLHVPRRDTIALDAIDHRVKQPIAQRTWAIPLLGELTDKHSSVPPGVSIKLKTEMMGWYAFHRQGGQGKHRFGHAYGEWPERYMATHPEYFAKPPAGRKPIRDERAKLCTSHPGVSAQILTEWRAAGRPDSWNACPNDSIGFCTCAACQKLDGDSTATDAEIWMGKAPLTRRYVAHWNDLITQMRVEKPNASLCTYAYSGYRDMPPGVTLKPGIVVQIIGRNDGQAQWDAWHVAGATMSLRPNWFFSGGIAPYIPLHQTGEFFRHACQNGMVQYQFDSLHGHWATQGPNYYLIARLSVRPDLSVDDVIEEYCSAFGDGAPHVRRYLDFWESYSRELAIPVAAGGVMSLDSNGLFERTCREHGLNSHPIAGSWQALPYLYPNRKLAAARAILDEAAQAAGNDPLVLRRIEFLRDGLQLLRVTRDTIALSYAPKRPEGLTPTDLQQRIDEWRNLRLAVTGRHVTYADVFATQMQAGGIRPEADTEADLNGL